MRHVEGDEFACGHVHSGGSVIGELGDNAGGITIKNKLNLFIGLVPEVVDHALGGPFRLGSEDEPQRHKCRDGVLQLAGPLTWPPLLTGERRRMSPLSLGNRCSAWGAGEPCEDPPKEI